MSRKQSLQFISAVLIPTFALGLIVIERLGFWDWCLGLNEVRSVADRFETSYAEGVDRQIGSDERAWKPLLNLIYKYSAAKIPRDRHPVAVVRWQAVLSNKVEIGAGQIAEWTAPSTPIAIVFKQPGAPLRNDDYLIVGSIGDLRHWIEMRHADLKFILNDVTILLTTIALGFLLWFADLPEKLRSKSQTIPNPKPPELGTASNRRVHPAGAKTKSAPEG